MPYEANPVADLFPMLADDELAELADSIKKRGLDHPIILDADGRVLDGRNRLAACKLAGVEPRFERYEGDDADDYALRSGITRRHLTTGARAMIAAKADRLGSKSATDEEDDKLNKHRLYEARLVLDWTPAIADAVIAGVKPLSGAVEEARAAKRDAEDLQAKLDRLRTSASDLLAHVEEERMDVDDAIAALEAREEKAREEADVRAVEDRHRAEEAAARAKRVSESLRMAINTLTKAFGTDELRDQAAAIYVAAEYGSEINQNIDADDLDVAAKVCQDLADRWGNHA